VEALQELEKVATFATGLPIENVARLSRNYMDFFNGDEDNVLKLFGYSDWAVEDWIEDSPRGGGFQAPQRSGGFQATGSQGGFQAPQRSGGFQAPQR
jgi:hypothetical protein